MFLQIILLAAGVVLLILIYKKIDAYLMLQGNLEENRKRENTNFQNWLFRELSSINIKINELSDVLTIENPAWGVKSADSLKKENLIKLYSQYLVEKEKISQEDALCKAAFVIYNFDNGVSEEIRRSARFNNEINSEKELLSSDLFKKEILEKMSTLTPQEIYGPLYNGIMRKVIKKGETLIQNTRKAFESYDGMYGYKRYIEDAAIICKLEQLNILATIKAKNEISKTMSGSLFYTLVEDDLASIRKIIFKDDDKYAYYDDSYFENKLSDIEQNVELDLPFKHEFAW